MIRRHPQFLKGMHWKLLRQQKLTLLELQNSYGLSSQAQADMEGIIYVIDACQDYAVDKMGVSNFEVFGAHKKQQELDY